MANKKMIIFKYMLGKLRDRLAIVKGSLQEKRKSSLSLVWRWAALFPSLFNDEFPIVMGALCCLLCSPVYPEPSQTDCNKGALIVRANKASDDGDFYNFQQNMDK